MSDTQGHEYLRSHQITGAAMLIDLTGEAADVMDVARHTRSGQAAKTLIKEGPLRVLILGLTRDAVLKEHQAGGPVSIQLLFGSVDIAAGDESYSLKDSGLLMFDSAVQHSVVAIDDSVILLTIALPLQGQTEVD